MSETNTIQFYYDFISPYAYLGWIELQRFVKQDTLPIVIQPIPILFAGLLNHWGQKGPAEISAKRTFTFQDVTRRATKMGIPLHLPFAHPFNPLLPLRTMIALDNSPKRDQAISEIFEACWQHKVDITHPSNIVEILYKLDIEDPTQVLSSCQSQGIKDKLRTNTKQALELGVFGVPTFVVNQTIFWGSDQIEFVKDSLQGKDPAVHQLDALAELPKAASRQ